MKKRYSLTIIFICLFCSNTINAQIDLQCSGRDQHSIYLVNINGFFRIDSVDTNPTDPIFIETNPFSNANLADGIAICNNLDSVSGPQTMYYINNNGPYYFWNGTGWTSTNHDAGSFFSVNPGGSADYIYNVDGVGGTIYKYDGTGNAVPLVTGLGNNLNIVYDIAADNQGNFYIYANSINKIYAFNPSGIVIDSFSTTGFTTMDECGLAILGNKIYATSCNNNYGLYEGIKTGNTINFTLIKSLVDFYIDIAACPDAGNPLAVFTNPEQPHFSVYPNPAKEKVIIKLQNTVSVVITDYTGSIIDNFETEGLTSLQLDVSKWEKGVYILSMTSRDGLVNAGKLVVN